MAQEKLLKQDVKSYRPTGVYLLTSGKELVTVNPAKALDRDYFIFPQGGFEDGETVQENIFRELKEELGILSSELEILSPDFYSFCLDSSNGRSNGYSGKEYIFSLIRYFGDGDFILKKDEISRLRWEKLPFDASSFSNHREERRIHEFTALEWAIRRHPNLFKQISR